MSFLLTLSSTSQLWTEDKDVVSAYIDKYYDYIALPNCYEKNNALQANLDSNQLCALLYPTGNRECEVLPQGIYLDIEISNWPDEFMRVQFIDFHYETTEKLCADCPEINGVRSCEFLKYTDSTKMSIRTLIYEAEIVVGKLQLGHSDLANCYDISGAALRYGQNTAQLDLKWTKNCKDATVLCNQMFSVVDMQFYDGDVLYYTQFVEDFTFVVNGDRHIIQFQMDISYVIERILSKVDVQLTMECEGGTTTRYLTTVAAFGSINIREIMAEPVLMFYPNKIVISHRFISNAEEMEEELKDLDVVSVEVLLRLFDTVTNSYYFSIRYNVPTFSFTTDEDKTFWCVDTEDWDSCVTALHDAFQTDKLNSQMNVLVYYLGTGGEVLIIASQAISDVRDACWTDVEAVYYKTRYCIQLSNSNSETCPFNVPKDVIISVDFVDAENTLNADSFVYSKRYSTVEEEVCFDCAETQEFESEQECSEKLAEYFIEQRRLRIRLEEISQVGNVQEIDVLKLFNRDYSELFAVIFYCGMVIACLAVALIILEIVNDLGCLKSRKVKGKVVNVDDLELHA